jgi:hypothetical protein
MPGHRTWEDEIYKWTVLANPSLLSLPHLQLGFSQFRLETHPRFFTEVPAFTLEIEPVAEQSNTPLPFTPARLPLEQEIPRSWPLTSISQPTQTQQALPNTVIWRQADGALLMHMPKLPEAKLNAALAAVPPTGLTAIQISRSNGMVRVRLIRSCGNRELDALALAAVGQNVTRFEGLERSFGKPEASLFFPPAENPTNIQVEWRMRKPNPQPE